MAPFDRLGGRHDTVDVHIVGQALNSPRNWQIGGRGRQSRCSPLRAHGESRRLSARIWGKPMIAAGLPLRLLGGPDLETGFRLYPKIARQRGLQFFFDGPIGAQYLGLTFERIKFAVGPDISEKFPQRSLEADFIFDLLHLAPDAADLF